MIPCKNCTDRHAGCHAECDKYQAWSKERREAKERDYDTRVCERYIVERDKRNKNKMLREKARGRKR